MKPRQIERFWRSVDKTPGHGPRGDCWLWTGRRYPDPKRNYGRFEYDGRKHVASRVAMELDGRPLSEGLLACHSCDNPPCVRPGHLFAGTHSDNAQDSVAKGRRAKAICRNGHDMTETAGEAGGRKICKACYAAACKRYREKRKAQ